MTPNRNCYRLWLFAVASFVCFQLCAETAAEKKGREQYEELRASSHFVEDPLLNAYVDRIGQTLAAQSNAPDINFQFFILDDPGINAFATYGGYIYINRGLLTYLTSEAQLASVLGHEIAHVTQNHHDRQKNATTTANVASFVASLVTLNSQVGEAISLASAERISGFGREMELEADAVGAQYMYDAGYDPAAMIEMLSILKDHQLFSSQLSREQGGQSTYHGVFASHPRSDTRLKEVIAQAGQLPPGEGIRGRDSYRSVAEGMVYGTSRQMFAPPNFQRFAHKGLGVTLLYPADWTQNTTGNRVVFSAPNATLQLTVQVDRLPDQPPAALDLLNALFSEYTLSEPTAIHEEIPIEESVTGLFVGERNGAAFKSRAASIVVGRNIYHFWTSLPTELSAEQDEVVLEIIESFRRAAASDYPPDEVLSLYFRRLAPGETFADLARETSSILGRNAEEYLRLINGYYPSGEPEPGTWIKLVK